MGLVPEQDLNLLFPVLGGDNVKAEVVYQGPIDAPVAKGQQLAELVIEPEGLPEIRRPLVAVESVAEGGFVVRMMTVGSILAKDIINRPQGAM